MKTYKLLFISCFCLFLSFESRADWIDRLDAAITRVRTCRDLFKKPTPSIEFENWLYTTAAFRQPGFFKSYYELPGDPVKAAGVIRRLVAAVIEVKWGGASSTSDESSPLNDQAWRDLLGKRRPLSSVTEGASGGRLNVVMPETPGVAGNRTREFMSHALRGHSAVVFERSTRQVLVKRLRDGSFIAIVDKFVEDEEWEVQELVPDLKKVATHSTFSMPLKSGEHSVESLVELMQRFVTRSGARVLPGWKEKVLNGVRKQAWQELYRYKYKHFLTMDDDLNEFSAELNVALQLYDGHIPETRDEIENLIVNKLNIDEIRAQKRQDEYWIRPSRYYSREQRQSNLQRVFANSSRSLQLVLNFQNAQGQLIHFVIQANADISTDQDGRLNIRFTPQEDAPEIYFTFLADTVQSPLLTQADLNWYAEGARP